MYEKLAIAGQAGGSVTFPDGKDQVDQIRRLAFKVADEFGKNFALNVSGNDVTVSFS